MRDRAINAWTSACIDARAITEAQAHDLTHRIDEKASRALVPLYAWLQRHTATKDSARLTVALSYDGAVRPGIDITMEGGAVRISICPWADGRILAIVTDAFSDWVRQLRRVPLLTDADRRALIIGYVREHPGCSIRQVIFGLSGQGMAKMTVQRHLNTLIGDGAILAEVRVSPGNTVSYSLTVKEYR